MHPTLRPHLNGDELSYLALFFLHILHKVSKKEAGPAYVTVLLCAGVRGKHSRWRLGIGMIRGGNKPRYIPFVPLIKCRRKLCHGLHKY